MKIDLNSFERELKIEATLEPEEIDLGVENARLDHAILFKGAVRKDADSVVLSGTFAGQVNIDCDRCLASRAVPIEITADREFVADERMAAKAEHELGPDDLNMDLLSGDELDLTEIAREEILLALPQQFFCKEDCKGLCEKCGADLNLKDCECSNEEIDPRWAALKNLN